MYSSIYKLEGWCSLRSFLIVLSKINIGENRGNLSAHFIKIISLQLIPLLYSFYLKFLVVVSLESLQDFLNYLLQVKV